MKSKFKKNSTFYFLIFILFSTFYFLFSDIAWASTLYFLPQGQTVYQDSSFIIELRIDTAQQEINVVKAELVFPADSLEFIEFNKGGSILVLWPEEPEISDNKISFIGGLPGGFKGQGLLGRIIFKAKQVSQVEIDFIRENCHVLLNDGQGTADSLIFLEANYQITEKPKDSIKISSNTHPDQFQWSKSNTLHLHWDLVEGDGYSYLLSQDPLAQPDEIADQPVGELVWVGDIEYANLDDGIYYFSLRQCAKPSENGRETTPKCEWGPVVSYRAMIDATASEEFDLKIGQEPAMFQGKYFLSFNTTDQTSGIAYYEIKEGKNEFKKAVSPYLLEDQTLGSKIIVKAVDQAGNERTAQYIPEREPEIIYLLIFIIIIVLALIIWAVRKKFLISKL